MKDLRRFFLAFFTCLLGLQGAALADGFIIVDRPVPHPHPHPNGRRPMPMPRPIQRFMPLEVKNHFVTVDIKDQVAVTSVDQVFHNPSGQRLEGTYLFPIPKGAEIDKFEMDVNGEMMEAELLDAGKARKIYEDIVRKAKDPALMEYAGQGLFKVRIFPIEPRSDKRVKLKYTQVLKRDGRLVDYTYPLNTEKFSSRPVGEVSVKVDVRAAGGIKSIYSPSHEIEVSRKGDERAVVGFEEKNTKPDTDFKLLFATGHRDADVVGVEMLAHSRRDGGEDGHFMMLISPGVWEKKDAVVPKDIVFVLDSSGSMRTKKLDQAKAALDFCLDNLNEGDRFEIVRYSTEAEALFDELRPADEKHLTQAREYLDEIRAGGGTAIEEALLQSVSYAGKKAAEADTDRPYQVIFLTDGRPTIGETRADKILGRLDGKVGRARVFCFGIGTDINTKLLDLVAEKTRAVTEYVLPEEDIEHKVSRFYSKIATPVMANLKLEVKGGDVRLSERYPKDLPDLFKGDQLVVFGRYKRGDKSKVKLQLSGSLAGERRSFDYKVKFDGERDNKFIPRLWATRRVGYLLDEIRLRGESSEIRDEVVELARKYGIVTPYTSYLIVEDEIARNVPVARQSLNMRMRGQVGGDKGAGLRRAEERDAFKSLAKDESGDGAVAASRSGSKLKEAKTPQAARESAEEAKKIAGRSKPGNSVAGEPSDDAEGEVQAESEAVMYRGGKTFYLNGGEWVDSEAQAMADGAKITVVEFGTDEYFELLASSAEVAKWLSVGDAMQLVIEGKLYRIRPEKKSDEEK